MVAVTPRWRGCRIDTFDSAEAIRRLLDSRPEPAGARSVANVTVPWWLAPCRRLTAGRLAGAEGASSAGLPVPAALLASPVELGPPVRGTRGAAVAVPSAWTGSCGVAARRRARLVRAATSGAAARARVALTSTRGVRWSS